MQNVLRFQWVPQLAFVLIVSQLIGCTNTIIPPKHVNYGRTVYVLDFGRHSSLLLPAADPHTEGITFTEYAYGDWKWYAEQRTGLTRVVPTLFWPTQGTFGRHTAPLAEPVFEQRAQIVNLLSFSARAERRAVMRDFNPDELHYICVESDRIESLRQELDERFARSGIEPKFVPEYRLSFVPDEAKYTAFHNCNHEVLSWLRALGCETRGTGIFADFKVEGVPSMNRKDLELESTRQTEGLPALPIPSPEDDRDETENSDSTGGME